MCCLPYLPTQQCSTCVPVLCGHESRFVDKKTVLALSLKPRQWLWCVKMPLNNCRMFKRARFPGGAHQLYIAKEKDITEDLCIRDSWHKSDVFFSSHPFCLCAVSWGSVAKRKINLIDACAFLLFFSCSVSFMHSSKSQSPQGFPPQSYQHFKPYLPCAYLPWIAFQLGPLCPAMDKNQNRTLCTSVPRAPWKMSHLFASLALHRASLAHHPMLIPTGIAYHATIKFRPWTSHETSKALLTFLTDSGLFEVL